MFLGLLKGFLAREPRRLWRLGFWGLLGGSWDFVGKVISTSSGEPAAQEDLLDLGEDDEDDLAVSASLKNATRKQTQEQIIMEAIEEESLQRRAMEDAAAGNQENELDSSQKPLWTLASEETLGNPNY